MNGQRFSLDQWEQLFNGLVETPQLDIANLRPNDDATLSLADYERRLGDLPGEVAERIEASWGDPADDPGCSDGAFRFRTARFGNVLVALPPDRGRTSDRRAAYHDAALPPRHALLAFALWLRQIFKADAMVHMGAHGTLEWLPGKAVALTAACFPEAVTGALPVLYGLGAASGYNILYYPLVIVVLVRPGNGLPMPS